MFRCLIGLCLVALAGCGASATAHDDPLAVAPMDLRLDVVVRSGGEEGAALRPVATRPGRFILLPDGALHYAVASEERPPRIRVLTRQQIAGVWSLLEDLALTEGEAGGNPELAAPGPGELFVCAEIRAAGRLVQHRSLGPLDEPDPRLTRLVRALGRLAWVDDTPAVAGRALPRRYDFGPDPYARYRETPEP